MVLTKFLQSVTTTRTRTTFQLPDRDARGEKNHNKPLLELNLNSHILLKKGFLSGGEILKSSRK